MHPRPPAAARPSVGGRTGVGGDWRVRAAPVGREGGTGVPYGQLRQTGTAADQQANGENKQRGGVVASEQQKQKKMGAPPKPSRVRGHHQWWSDGRVPACRAHGQANRPAA